MKPRLRLTYVVASFPPSTAYGGPAESSYRLCRHLQELGVAVRVVTVAADGERDPDVDRGRWTSWGGLRVFYARRIGRTLVAPRLWLGAAEAWRDTDVVHLSVAYSMLLPVGVARARRRGLPVVYSPRGIFLPQALGRHRWRKLLFVATVGRLCYRSVAIFHATSGDEAEAVRRLLPGVRTEIVPNGVDVPEGELPAPAEAGRRPYLLYLGRLHPHKRIDRILEAFDLGCRAGEAELWIAGTGEEAERRRLESLAAERGLAGRVRFLGHVAGERKSAVLAHALALVLASRSESFGLSVAEALAHATPAVVTRTAPWAGLESEGCGFWVDEDPESLADGLRRICGAPQEARRRMGEAGRSWMKRDFAWPAVARRMAALYESLR